MKITKKLVVLLLSFFLVLSSICLASAEPVVTSNDLENTTKSPVTNIMNTDLYVGEQDVVIEDVVNGNVFAFGSTVTVKGEIVGDLFVMANTLTIEESAVIYNNIFALANTFVMKGNAYDIYALANNFELASSGYVYRDIRLYAESVNLSGLIKKDAYIFSSSITMPENAKSLIGGNLNYTSTQEFSIPEGAVLGEVKYTPYEENTVSAGKIILSYITSFITTILYAIVIILLATFFAPKFIEKANYVLIKKPFISAGIGILSIVLIPVLAIILLMTGFLSYISIAILVVYGLILSITLAIFSMAIGKYIVDKIKNPSKVKFILFSILSAIVLWLLQIIPYIGNYMSLFIYVVGLGVFLFAFFMRKDVNEANNSK